MPSSSVSSVIGNYLPNDMASRPGRPEPSAISYLRRSVIQNSYSLPWSQKPVCGSCSDQMNPVFSYKTVSWRPLYYYPVLCTRESKQITLIRILHNVKYSEAGVQKSSKNLGARKFTWPTFHTENPPNRSDLWTSLLPGALCSVRATVERFWQRTGGELH